MQVQIGVTLDASPALLEVLNNLTAALTADSTIARAARTPRATKKDAPAADPAPAEVPGKPASPAAASTPPVDTPAEKTEPPTEAPGKSVPAAETPPAAASTSTPASGSATAAASTPSAITREQIRVALGKLAQTDKAKALAILAEHGAASVTALAVKDYPAVLAAATA